MSSFGQAEALFNFLLLLTQARMLLFTFRADDSGAQHGWMLIFRVLTVCQFLCRLPDLYTISHSTLTIVLGGHTPIMQNEEFQVRDGVTLFSSCVLIFASNCEPLYVMVLNYPGHLAAGEREVKSAVNNVFLQDPNCLRKDETQDIWAVAPLVTLHSWKSLWHFLLKTHQADLEAVQPVVLTETEDRFTGCAMSERVPGKRLALSVDVTVTCFPEVYNSV